MKKQLFKAFRILFTIALLFMVYRESGFYTSLFCTMIAAVNEIMVSTQKKQTEFNAEVEKHVIAKSAANLTILKKIEEIKKHLGIN